MSDNGKIRGDQLRDLTIEGKKIADNTITSEKMLSSGSSGYVLTADGAGGALWNSGGADSLKLDQTYPQTVDNGMPVFNGGLTVPSEHATYTGTNSPILWNGHSGYIPTQFSTIWIANNV